jgi:hypothetical protein
VGWGLGRTKAGFEIKAVASSAKAVILVIWFVRVWLGTWFGGVGVGIVECWSIGSLSNSELKSNTERRMTIAAWGCRYQGFNHCADETPIGYTPCFGGRGSRFWTNFIQVCVGKFFESYKGFCLQEAERRASLNASKANYHKGVAVPRNFQSIYIFIAQALPFVLRNSTIRLRPPLSGITLKYSQWQYPARNSKLSPDPASRKVACNFEIDDPNFPWIRLVLHDDIRGSKVSMSEDEI